MLRGRPVWLKRLPLVDVSSQGPALDAALSGVRDAAGLAEFVVQERAAIRQEGLTGTDAAVRYSDVVDAVLRRMLALALDEHGISAEGAPSVGLAILATGGYGRRELAPFSDIDITFVPARDDDPVIEHVVRTLFQMIMDAFVRKATLKVGYAYRLIAECRGLEVQTKTSLVDARWVAGDYGLFSDFKEELRQEIDPARFVFDRIWERVTSRRLSGESIYRLEPDLKNGPGGLREIQTAMWMAEVRFGVWSPAVWEELIDRGVVSFRRVERLYEALEFIHTLRNHLHWRAGKQNDILLAANQSVVAESLGFSEQKDLTPSQELMAVYFRHAEIIHSTAQRVVNWVLESRLELGMGLACVRRQIECSTPEVFLSRPANIVRAFSLSQSIGVPFSHEFEAIVRSAVEGSRALQPDHECGPLLLEVLEAPERVWPTLRSMTYLRVLGWLMPEFAPLMSLAPRNSAHEFTVGYHSLEVVRRLEEMRVDSGDSVYAEVFSHQEYPAVLFLAALLHDAGKAMPGNHSEAGAAMVAPIGIRLGMASDQVRRVETLVRFHLLMPEIAHFRDLTREEPVRELIAQANEQETLEQLFLLSYADGMSVGQGVWTPIQTRFLEQLYMKGREALAHPYTETGEIDMRRYHRRVTRALTAHNLPPDEVAPFVELMPASYLLNTPAETMALHIDMLRKLQQLGVPVVEFREDHDGHFTELTICALDDPTPGLLSRVAGCLWSANLSVHGAQVYTREGDCPVAIDTLWVDYHGRPLDPYQKRNVENDLVSVLSGATLVSNLLVERGKGPDLSEAVRDLDVQATRTNEHIICEVQAGEQRGLLYRLTRAISDLGWDIHSARISSGVARARDVFYIGAPADMPADEAAEALRARLLVLPVSQMADGQ
jgi:[protein-PII] uridylyltransferase